MRIINLPSPNQNIRGFSLTEVLIVVSVIGIFTAISITQFGNAKDASDESRDRTNAKNLVTVFQAGASSGIDFYVDGNLAQTITNVVVGGTATDGVFAGTFFSLPDLSSEAQTSAMTYLRLENGLLVYDPGFVDR